MNYKMLFFIISFLFVINSYSQAPTTEEEYNYCVKGYKIMTSSGLDMKKGYSMKNLYVAKEGNYEFDIKMMVRDNTNEGAAILIMAKSAVSGTTYYHCIPHHNRQLLENYWSDLSAWDKPMLLSYTKVIAAYFGTLVPDSFEMRKEMTKPKR